MSGYLFIIIVFYISFLLPSPGLSDISVQDMLVLKGEEVMLSAKTTGKFFPQGGKVVEFFINGKSIGQSLSGGDGIAYKQFIPPETGLLNISVKSGDDENKGLLLSLNEGNKVIFIDIEGSLFEGIFSQRPRERSQEVIQRLSNKFPVVFLQTGLLSTELLKSWLKQNSFIDAPVLSWGQGFLFDEISKKEIKIKAIIGSASVIESAKEYKPQSFSFDEAEDAETVNDWWEIGEILIKKKKSGSIDRTGSKNQ